MENSTEQLFKAVIHIDGHKTGSMAFSVRAPIDLVVSGDILVSFKEHDIRFVYDKNWPKLQIDSLSDIDFYSDFSPTFQRFKFSKRNETIVVSGTRHDSSDKYVLTIHLSGVKAK